MEIKFDLKDAKIFIPLGRKGNLKKELWSNINLSTKDFDAFARSDTSYDMEPHFDEEIEKLVNFFRKHETKTIQDNINNRAKTICESAINDKPREDFLNLLMLSNKLLQDSCNAALSNPQIDKKIQKLRKIQQFNALKGD